MDASSGKRTVHPAVKYWVAFHAVMVLLWSTPHPSQLAKEQFQRSSLVEKLSNPKDTLMVVNDGVFKGEWFGKSDPLPLYFQSTGLWQWWDMFAPNPASTDVYMDAEVEYEDGTVAFQPYPRMYDMPVWLKYFKERYRKYRERLTNDSESWKWPHTAQRLALVNYRHTGRIPVRVRLWRHWMDVAPLGQPQPTNYNAYMFWDQEIDQAKVLEDAK